MDQEEARELRRALRDGDPEQRIAKIEELAAADDESVVPFVYGALEDRNVAVRSAALRALAKLKPGIAVLTAIERAVSTIPEERRAAIALLRDNPDERALLRLHEIAEKDEFSTESRVDAVMAIGELADDRSVTLVEQLVDDDDVDVRIAAVRALRNLNLPQSTGLGSHMHVSRKLGAKAEEIENDDERAAIVGTLGQIAEWYSLPRMVEWLDDDAAQVRLAAIEAVATTTAAKKNEDAIEKILAGIVEEEDVAVRAAMIDAAGMLKVEDAVDSIVDALGDDEASIREAAVRALIELKAEDALDAIEELEEDDSEEVRDLVERARKKLG